MIKKRTLGQWTFTILNVVFLTLASAVFILPILHVGFGSISEPAQLLTHQGVILRPLGFTLRGYEIVFENPNLVTSYLNTIFYVVTGTALSLLLSAMGGYALSRKKVLWKNHIMLFIAFTMLFNGGLIPFYMVVKGLNLIDTRLAMILPTAVSAFNLIIVRTSMGEIPSSLEESAKIDGASHFTILFKIIIPLSKSILAVIVLFSAVTNWNAWFNARIFLSKRSLFPLQLILREILIENDISKVMQGSFEFLGSEMYRQLVKYSAIMVAIIPILCIYPFLQRYFVKGVMIGSIKG